MFDRWREYWATSPANPKTWTKEDWIADREIMRIVLAFAFGIFLGPISFGAPPYVWVILPILFVFMIFAERDYMKTIRSFDNEG